MVMVHLAPDEVDVLLHALVQARAFSKVLMALGLEPPPDARSIRRV